MPSSRSCLPQLKIPTEAQGCPGTPAPPWPPGGFHKGKTHQGGKSGIYFPPPVGQSWSRHGLLPIWPPPPGNFPTLCPLPLCSGARATARGPQQILGRFNAGPGVRGPAAWSRWGKASQRQQCSGRPPAAPTGTFSMLKPSPGHRAASGYTEGWAQIRDKEPGLLTSTLGMGLSP